MARLTGLRDLCRESKGHPLNRKEVAHRHAAALTTALRAAEIFGDPP